MRYMLDLRTAAPRACTPIPSIPDVRSADGLSRVSPLHNSLTDASGPPAPRTPLTLATVAVAVAVAAADDDVDGCGCG